MSDGRDGVVALVYTSTASQPLRETALEHLLGQCRTFNAEHGITGMLLHRDGRFIQVLEGAREAVEELAERIRRDRRHHDMTVLLEEPIDQRRFADWSMGYCAFRRAGEDVPRGYRDSFSDLDAGAATSTVMRALAELTVWFRVRSGALASA